MNEDDRIKLFEDVFSPKKNERVLVLIDKPHDDILDNDKWVKRREMAKEWVSTLKKMGEKKGFFVEMSMYPATGVNNSQIPDGIKDLVKKYQLVIAMTEFSASSSLMPICRQENSTTRCASMPGVEKRMEETALRADYSQVRHYAYAIENLLSGLDRAEIDFSNGDHLCLDLRNRSPNVDTGECKKAGQTINFPSGEGCIAPYEAVASEIDMFGESRTTGFLPVFYDEGIIRYEIKNNTIRRVHGNGAKAKKMERFFDNYPCRRNIAELGIGCNPDAVVTGNVLEDEKVPGLHIAYGMSSHLGGKIDCDVHQDICYPKGAPIAATSLVLIGKDERKTRLIDEDGLRFDLLIDKH